MHRTNEANLSSVTDNLEKLRECFGQWVNLSIESDLRVVVTSSNNSIFKKRRDVIRLGELSKEKSRDIAVKIISGKRIKARICDFHPSFLCGFKKDAEVMISIWEN